MLPHTKSWIKSLVGACLLVLLVQHVPIITAQLTSYTVGVVPCTTTIQACIDLASGGDSIFIPAGTYTESLILTKAVNLTGANTATTILRADPAANQRVLTITGLAVSNTMVSQLTITGGHKTSDNGGGILITGGAQHITLTHLAIVNNFTNFNGGGIFASGDLTLTHSTVASNMAYNNGGGIGSSSGWSLYIANVTVRGNSALGSPGYGGGISNYGNATLVNITVDGNKSRHGGGIANVGAPSLMSITNATISGNGYTQISGNDGFGIYNGGTITVTNITISGNGNTASLTNGAIANDGPSFVLQNTLIANNIGLNCSFGMFADGGGNFQYNPNAGCPLPTGDPKLGPLASNGGSTQTLALSTGSAAIDAANPSFCPILDQRGYSRPNPCDSGAFEFGGIAPYNINLPAIQR